MAKLIRWTDPEMGGKVLVFNQSPVALCLLWSMMDKVLGRLFQEGINHNPFGIVGNLRTPMGISWFLRGLCQLPQIEEVVIYGVDGTGTGTALINLWEKGLGDGFTVPVFGWPIDKNITLEAVEELRKKVKITNRVGVRDVLRVANEFPLKPKIFSPKREKIEFLPYEVPERMELPSDGTGFHFRADDIFSAWLLLINAVLRLGKRRATRKNEIIAHLFHISATWPVGEEEVICSGFGLKKEDVEIYCQFFFDSVKMPDNDYGYFERIVRWGGDLEELKDPNFRYNQREKVLKRLKDSPDTKRASVVLLGPRDLEDLEDAPCFVLYTLSVTDGRLDCSAIFRSHDMSNGWPNNLFAITRMLREDAKELGLKPGFITVVSQNAQIYERNFERVQEVIEKFGPSLSNPGKLLKFKDDPAGNFVFSVDQEKKIATVRMMSPDQSIILFKQEHKNPKVLMNWIVASFSWLLSSHTLYLGQEMRKMEEALEKGTEYYQS
ncbi:MAG: hypothetical protein A2390_00710 [Candidatus Liptonbacteria bacterium RIFOXYB1_FULL_36_10]|uniref:Uncharacterized protein n=2 Tax=Candidatus Liptoniibacteriota TaxID=1817909 RepID=A0A1G2CRZ9_9BACT|nr:MAG: hypothetical protein A2604_00060 [Candidatus Liptonbacteria bacterium RIFOXYD1_FULL_36_11]OGZ03441.1 MAG: hypothetical protein A2390_00710 [Candidatus Liptonbacteria bacterium RIFOXYB1_FULL_36_10]